MSECAELEKLSAFASRRIRCFYSFGVAHTWTMIYVPPSLLLYIAPLWLRKVFHFGDGSSAPSKRCPRSQSDGTGRIPTRQCMRHISGITALGKVSAVVAAAGISMSPHACEGPIGGLATLHVDAAMPNFLIPEICSRVQPTAMEKVWEEWFGFPAIHKVNGRFPLPDKPGLGFELTEGAPKKLPFGGHALWRASFMRTGLWLSGNVLA